MENTAIPVVLRILDYTIPLFGNQRCHPYGKLLVSDGKLQRVVKFGYRLDSRGCQENYITFNRKRYKYRNIGSVYYPQIVLLPY